MSWSGKRKRDESNHSDESANVVVLSDSVLATLYNEEPPGFFKKACPGLMGVVQGHAKKVELIREIDTAMHSYNRSNDNDWQELQQGVDNEWNERLAKEVGKSAALRGALAVSKQQLQTYRNAAAATKVHKEQLNEKNANQPFIGTSTTVTSEGKNGELIHVHTHTFKRTVSRKIQTAPQTQTQSSSRPPLPKENKSVEKIDGSFNVYKPMSKEHEKKLRDDAIIQYRLESAEKQNATLDSLVKSLYVTIADLQAKLEKADDKLKLLAAIEEEKQKALTAVNVERDKGNAFALALISNMKH